MILIITDIYYRRYVHLHKIIEDPFFDFIASVYMILEVGRFFYCISQHTHVLLGSCVMVCMFWTRIWMVDSNTTQKRHVVCRNFRTAFKWLNFETMHAPKINSFRPTKTPRCKLAIVPVAIWNFIPRNKVQNVTLTTKLKSCQSKLAKPQRIFIVKIIFAHVLGDFKPFSISNQNKLPKKNLQFTSSSMILRILKYERSL